MDAERHRRVMEIVADAVECDAGGREALLAAACGESPSLRREVEALLRHQVSASRFLEESPLGGLSAEPSGSLVGRRLGPYTVRHVIGRGGMGIVYLAERDDEEYRMRVAVKLLARGDDSEAGSHQFRKERQILADLDHPNIARLLDGGTTEEGVPYLVMEYVEGLPVTRYARETGLTTAERLTLFRTVCSAVHYAHGRGVVHRDIKPGNILVNESGVPKLLDFGIAKLLDQEQPTGGAEHPTAAQVMTTAYASPEQVRGEAVGAASDVYSLGVVLYELLTGRRPFKLAGRKPDEVARVISEQEPLRPSQAVSAPGEAAGGSERFTPSAKALKGDLDNILMMALRKEPARRYESVEHFSADVRRHLEGLPVRARKDAITYRLTKFAGRNRVALLSSLSAALLCLLLGLWIGLFSARREVRDTVAVLPIESTNPDAGTEYLSDGLTDYFIGYFSRLGRLTVPGRNSVLRYKGKPIAPADAGTALGVRTLLTGRMTTRGDGITIRLSLIDAGSGQEVWAKQYVGKAAEILTLQEVMAEDVLRTLAVPVGAEELPRARRIGTQSVEAYRLYIEGNYYWGQRTELGLRAAVHLFQRAAETDPQYSLAYSGLANSHSLMGAYKYGAPLDNFPKAKAAALKAVELDPRSAEAHTALALVTWLYDWDWAAADREFRLSTELSPNYVTAHHWYGLYLAEMGRFDEAITSEQRALALDPLSLYVTADLGRVYYYARRYDEALAQYRKGIEMGPTFMAFYGELLTLYEQTGDVNGLLAIGDRVFNLDEGTRAAWRARGMDAYWEDKLTERLKAGPTQLPYFTAEVYARQGRREEAFRALELAYRIRDHQMAQLKVNPAFDRLRPDPRFGALLRRMNLEP